jgi:hypothetical protein
MEHLPAARLAPSVLKARWQKFDALGSVSAGRDDGGGTDCHWR